MLELAVALLLPPLRRRRRLLLRRLFPRGSIRGGASRQLSPRPAASRRFGGGRCFRIAASRRRRAFSFRLCFSGRLRVGGRLGLGALAAAASSSAVRCLLLSHQLRLSCRPPSSLLQVLALLFLRLRTGTSCFRLLASAAVLLLRCDWLSWRVGGGFRFRSRLRLLRRFGGGGSFLLRSCRRSAAASSGRHCAPRSAFAREAEPSSSAASNRFFAAASSLPLIAFGARRWPSSPT